MPLGLQATQTVTQLRVPDICLGTEWYTKLFGRPPDLTPVEGVVEWEVLTGTWFQIIEARPDPGRNRFRFGVPDLRAELERLRDAVDLDLGEPVTIDGVIKYADGEDPFGNRIGLFEALNQGQAGD